MPALAALTTFVAGQVAQASQVNGNFAALRTWADNSVVLTDVAKTITASHTFSAAQTFSSTINGQTISAAASFTGTIGAAGEVSSATAVTVSGAAGTFRPLQISTVGSLRWTFTGSNEAEGGANAGTNLAIKRYADNGSFIEDAVTFNRAAGTTVFAKGVTITAGGLTVTAGGLTVTAGGASITGNTTITGNLTVTGTLIGVNTVLSAVQASDATTTSTSPSNTTLSIAVGASQTWRVDFDLAVSCDNTGGVTCIVTAPAGATIRTHWFGATSSATALASVSNTSGSSGGTAFSTFNSTASNGVRVTCSAYIVTSATAGNAGITFNAVVGGQTATVLAGSTVVAVRVS